MFTATPNDHPCKLIKLMHEKSDVKQSASPFCDAAYFKDCFRLKKANTILLFTDEQLFMFDDRTVTSL